MNTRLTKSRTSRFISPLATLFFCAAQIFFTSAISADPIPGQGAVAAAGAGAYVTTQVGTAAYNLINPTLYHVTSPQNLSSIMQNGLLPASMRGGSLSGLVSGHGSKIWWSTQPMSEGVALSGGRSLGLGAIRDATRPGILSTGAVPPGRLQIVGTVDATGKFTPFEPPVTTGPRAACLARFANLAKGAVRAGAAPNPTLDPKDDQIWYGMPHGNAATDEATSDLAKGAERVFDTVARNIMRTFGRAPGPGHWSRNYDFKYVGQRFDGHRLENVYQSEPW